MSVLVLDDAFQRMREEGFEESTIFAVTLEQIDLAVPPNPDAGDGSAVELFVQRASSVRHGFALDGTVSQDGHAGVRTLVNERRLEPARRELVANPPRIPASSQNNGYPTDPTPRMIVQAITGWLRVHP